MQFVKSLGALSEAAVLATKAVGRFAVDGRDPSREAAGALSTFPSAHVFAQVNSARRTFRSFRHSSSCCGADRDTETCIQNRRAMLIAQTKAEARYERRERRANMRADAAKKRAANTASPKKRDAAHGRAQEKLRKRRSI